MYFGWLKNLLRAGSRKWRPINATLKEGEAGTVVNPKTGRPNKAYKCVECGNSFMKAKRGTEGIQVDHIEAVVPEGKTIHACSEPGFDATLNVCIGEVAMRMFVEQEGLQLMCTTCNREKGNG